MAPKIWSKKKLIDVAPLKRGFDLTSDQIINGEYPVVYSNGVWNYHNKYMCKGPGVVTGRSGTIGKVFYVEQNYWPHNTSLWVTDFFGNEPKFIYYLYSFLNFGKISMGTGVPTLNRNHVHKKDVSIPPVAQQQKIVTTLDVWERAINLQIELIKKLKKQKRWFMLNLLTPKSNWTHDQIKNLIVSAPKSKRAAGVGLTHGRYIFFTNSDGEIKYLNEYDTDGEYIIANTGGIAMFKYYNGKFSYSMHCHVFSTKKLNPRFLFYYLDFTKNKINNLGFTGLGLKNFDFNWFNKLTIHYPNKKEQDLTVELFNNIDTKIQKHMDLLQLFNMQKRYLIKNLLTGRIITND